MNFYIECGCGAKIDSLEAVIKLQSQKIDSLSQAVRALKTSVKYLGEDMSREFDNITREVKENGDAIDSGVTLLDKLSDLIEAGKDDPAKMQALADEIRTKKEKLSAAILANTPADPAETE